MSVREIETLPGVRFGLVADAHIHAGQTPHFPEKLREVFARADAIIVLGDMGEAAGLDWLEQIAPVYGVRGADDPPSDTRMKGELRAFSIGGLTAAALFDGTKHGLFTSNDPLVITPDFPEILTQLFGGKPDILLCASTHKSLVASAQRVLIVNPGSPTLADTQTVALLHVADGVARVEHVAVG